MFEARIVLTTARLTPIQGIKLVVSLVLIQQIIICLVDVNNWTLIIAIVL